MSRADLQAGKKTEAELADDLKQFDALLAEHKGEKTDAVASILYMKAMLYAEVLDNPDESRPIDESAQNRFSGHHICRRG